MKTIADFIRCRAEDQNTALLYEDQAWTHQAFVQACGQRAAYLLANRLAGPFHVGVMLDNVPEFPFWLGACALAGATLVGINPTRKGADLQRDIAYTDCQFVITDQTYYRQLQGLNLKLSADRIHNTDAEAYRQTLATYQDSPLPEIDVNEQDCFCLIFTSGTSGAPKACICSHGRLVANSLNLSAGQQLNNQDVFYIAMPLYHSNSIMVGFLPTLITGGTMALRSKFSASCFLSDIRRYGATFFNYVGKPLAYVLATPEQEDDADNTLRQVFGNEAADVDIDKFSQRFGCTVTDAYGTTEGGATIIRVPNMPKGSLGLAISQSMMIMNPDTVTECPRALFDDQGQLLNANEAIGEMVDIKGTSAFEGYWKNDEANAKRTRGSIIWMGDLAYRDEQGFYYFAGRDSDWMRVDGENIATAQIEQVLYRHHDVMLAVVYPVPDPVVGDRVMAALQLREGAEFDIDEFLIFLTAQSDFGSKWMPSFIRVSAELPMTHTAKVIKRQLRQQHWHCDDPLWWKNTRDDPFRLMTGEDIKALEQQFAERGRANVLKLV